MILYHGSNIAIENIDLEKCKPYKDFGRGFYLTEIKTQAIQMANRSAAIYGGEAVVTKFEFDKDAAYADEQIKIKNFDTPDKDWALFIMNNRNRESSHPTHDFDIVIGAVADDAIATLFRNFSDGVIDINMLVAGLKFKDVSSQYFFHSHKSLKYLSKR